MVISGTVKKWISNMVSEMSITKKMLATLREGRVNQAKQASQVFVKEEKEADNFITRSKILMEEAIDKKKVLTEEELDDNHKKTFEIKKDTPQFGDVRTSQEEALRKTINDNIKFETEDEKRYMEIKGVNYYFAVPIFFVYKYKGEKYHFAWQTWECIDMYDNNGNKLFDLYNKKEFNIAIDDQPAHNSLYYINKIEECIERYVEFIKDHNENIS